MSLFEEQEACKQMPQEEKEEKKEKQLRWKTTGTLPKEKKTYAEVVKGHDEVTEHTFGLVLPESYKQPELSDDQLMDDIVTYSHPATTSLMAAITRSSEEADREKGKSRVKEACRDSICYQLREMGSKVFEIESLVSNLTHKLNTSELSNYMLRSETRELNNMLTELRKDTDRKSVDLSLFKDIVSYQDEARSGLNQQLTFLTSQLIKTTTELNDSLDRESELKRTIDNLRRKAKPWLYNK
jgi:chromosome segregation ATPase